MCELFGRAVRWAPRTWQFRRSGPSGSGTSATGPTFSSWPLPDRFGRASSSGCTQSPSVSAPPRFPPFSGPQCRRCVLFSLTCIHLAICFSRFFPSVSGLPLPCQVLPSHFPLVARPITARRAFFLQLPSPVLSLMGFNLSQFQSDHQYCFQGMWINIFEHMGLLRFVSSFYSTGRI
ncbi:hypothetical protein MPTK1_2g07640 [Marchantia polymorpha subsp. ruderalis]|uniref:Uncharacterized protein n=1 Tax=Marchantia polymorpha TaxID=3197 RepID=A0A2R6XGM1_MARPO|nr:hypothetical protein MARPO_0015s0050 [Marchantia polymorpha]BBN01474.1 hypothetical protein Mp_2g07640 [Marchantia polymorpha subsp. ruderalis]|eukprot:PTQ45241.1 hypothetical protein MARPO_0015s0050 [Marchantia polymorpha]